MQQPNAQNFGLIIAYLIPGLTALWGLSFFSETVENWLGAESSGPTVGGFLYATLASIGVGLIVSALRWLLVDQLFRLTGLKRDSLCMRKLQANIEAFKLMVEDHYRYYQFYANTFVASTFTYVSYRIKLQAPTIIVPSDIAFLLLILLLLVASRDTLQKYFQRTNQLAANPEQAKGPIFLFF